MSIQKGDDVVFTKRVNTSKGGASADTTFIPEGHPGKVVTDCGNGYYDVLTTHYSTKFGQYGRKVIKASSLVLKVVASQLQLALDGS